jgi:predicted dehydrogenase
MTAGRAPLGVLLAGYGGVGAQDHQKDMYAPAFDQHPDYDILAISDDHATPDDLRARSRDEARQRGVPYVEDLVEALELPGIDLLSVCTAFERRVAVAELAAGHGKHLLIDKPMALTLEDCDAIATTTTNAGVVCMPAHHQRYQASVRDARAAVAGGRIGLSWAVHADFIVTSRAAAASLDELTAWPLGELLNFAVYPIDCIRAMTGLEIRSVYATRGGFFYGNEGDEDFGVLALTLEHDVLATVSIGRAPVSGHLNGGLGEHRYRVMGSHGLLLVDAGKPAITVHGGGRSRRLPFGSDSVAVMLDELAAAIRTGRPADIGPSDAQAALAVTLAARQAADDDRVMQL